MARIKDNLLMTGARGNIGGQIVFKQHGKDTIITRMPVFPKKKPTKKQQKRRDIFGEAVAYAKKAVKDPILKREYQEKAGANRTAYHTALSDFMNAPVIENIDVTNYNGKTGSTITIKATDDFRVAEVTVSILNSSDVLIEEGNAILHPIDRTLWVYKATATNNSLKATKIKVVAKDIPGNEVRGESGL